MNPKSPNTTARRLIHSFQDAARARGVALSVHWIGKAEEIGGAIDEAKASGADALNVLASSLLNAHHHTIFERAAVLRLPAIYQWPETALPHRARVGPWSASRMLNSSRSYCGEPSRPNCR